MAEEEKKDVTGTDFVNYNRALLKEPWWVILIAGIVTLAFGAIVLAWPLMTLGFLVIFFGTLAIVFGAFGVIRSLFLIKQDKNWWILLIEGILGIIIGILVFVWPIGTTIFLVYFIAAWLLITGITAIAHGSTIKNTGMIVLGVLGLILGIFIFFRPPLYATATLLLFIGFFALFRGIALIIDSIVIAVAQKNARKAEAEAAAKQ
jgi:uncharacterized membrane protein HdeD (DUF308 family)